MTQTCDEQGHISLFYDTERECMQYMADYFGEGIEKNEMCILVSSLPVSVIARNIQEHGLDVHPHLTNGSLRIFDMQETYLPDNQFVASYMLGNIANFMQEAIDLGFSGLRTAGEMNWIDDPHVERSAANESLVNELDSRHFTGLCLYDTASASKQTLRNAIQTHPDFIYQGMRYKNHYYLTPDQFLKLTDEANSPRLAALPTLLDRDDVPIEELAAYNAVVALAL